MITINTDHLIGLLISEKVDLITLMNVHGHDRV